MKLNALRISKNGLIFSLDGEPLITDIRVLLLVAQGENELCDMLFIFRENLIDC